MKKRWKTALVMMAALALAGCGHNEKTSVPAKPAVKQAAKPAKKAFVLGGDGMTLYYAKGCQPLAAETAGYLRKVFGKEYKLKPYTSSDKDKPGIFIGVRPAGVKITADEKKEFCGRHVTDTQVYLFGNNSKILHGTAFSVYEFLEKEAGVRWLWPGRLGTVAEPQKPKVLKNGTEIFVPAFERRMTAVSISCMLAFTLSATIVSGVISLDGFLSDVLLTGFSSVSFIGCAFVTFHAYNANLGADESVDRTRALAFADGGALTLLAGCLSLLLSFAAAEPFAHPSALLGPSVAIPVGLVVLSAAFGLYLSFVRRDAYAVIDTGLLPTEEELQ